MVLPTPPDTPQASGQTGSSGVTEGSANDDATATPLPPTQQRHLRSQQVPPTPETPVASTKRKSREEATAAESKSQTSSSPGSESEATENTPTDRAVHEDEEDDDVEVIPRDVSFPATSHPHSRRRWRKQRGTFTLNAADYSDPEAARSSPSSPHSTEAAPFKPRRGSRGTMYEDSGQVVPGRIPGKRVAAEPKSRGLRVKLKLNLEVEITLKAQLHGDLLLTVL